MKLGRPANKPQQETLLSTADEEVQVVFSFECGRVAFFLSNWTAAANAVLPMLFRVRTANGWNDGNFKYKVSGARILCGAQPVGLRIRFVSGC